MRRTVVALVLAMAVAGLAATTADATVYSGTANYSAPTGTPSLNGPTPDPAQTAEYLHTLGVTYDDQTGTVKIRFSLYDPSTWGPILSNGDYGSGSGGQFLEAPLDFDLGFLGDRTHPANYGGQSGVFCQPGGLPGVNQPQFGGPVLGGYIASQYDNNGNFTGNTVIVSMDGYNGQVTAPVSFDGLEFTATVQNSAFRGQIWDCLSVNNTIEVPASPPPPPPGPNTLFNPWAGANGAFKVRPRMIGLSGDGSNYLAGRTKRSGISWSSWTKTKAVGSGADWQDNCRPSCVAGTFSPHAAKIRAFAPANGHFTRLWTKIKSRGRWHTYIRKLHRTNGYWGWR